jgi:RimJ/RimL family protein N-acetyltransferase
MRNPILAGERVYLRALEKDDAQAMALGFAVESESMMHRLRMPLSPMNWEAHIEGLHKQQPPGTIELGVCLREDDALIGSVEITQIDYVNRTAETGSWMARAEHRGKGYGTEAKHLLLEYAFDRVQLHVLYSWVWEPNTRSAAALMKQGYKPSGKLLRQDVKDGVYYGALMFDVKRDEWIEAREAWRESNRKRASNAAGAV